MASLNKPKKAVRKFRRKKSVSKTKKLKRTPPGSNRQAFLGAQETVIERAKFTYPEVSRPARIVPGELPTEYNRDRIILQVRDPYWIHAYWEIKGPTLERLRNDLKDESSRARRLLRVYDVSQIIFDGTNAHRFFDIEIGPQANNWYIDTGGPGRSWCVDLGLLLASGRFITILRSNVVHTPLDGPSWIMDEEWMIPDDMFARLYGIGFGRSSPVGKARRRGFVSSPGIASMASPVKIPKEKEFWLAVDCELIVYGATEPDAQLTVQNREVKLRPDGTFTLRFALPDGRQVIPVKATSSDKLQERTVTPIVSRETKTSCVVRD